MDENEKSALIAALIEERRGYEMRGLVDRVADVDSQLRDLGAGGAPPAKRATKRTPNRKTSESK